MHSGSHGHRLRCPVSSCRPKALGPARHRHCNHQNQPRCRRRTNIGSTEHSRYIVEIGVASQPAGIETLIEVLKGQGQEVVPPNQRNGLHPLAIPLTRGPAEEAGDEPDASVLGSTVYTCLLRWPASAAAQGLPVVRMSQGAPGVALLARSSDDYLRRALAEEDYAGGPGPVSAAVGADSDRLYKGGSVAASPLPSVNAWLTRQGSLYPDVIESLALGHLEKGDAMSAIITSEWYMKREQFMGWARPYEFIAQLYKRLGRSEEARDSSRVALYTPWWTLKRGFREAAELAGMPSDAASVHARLSEVAKASQTGGPLPPGIGVATKTDAQMAIDEAELLMNRVAAGEGEWDDIRPELARRYAEGGQKVVADFIEAAI